MSARSPRQSEEKETVLLGGHFSEPFARRFKVLAAKRGVTIRAQLEEAVNDLLEKHQDKPGQAADLYEHEMKAVPDNKTN